MTSLDGDLLKELKDYCTQNDYQLNQVITNALYLYFSIAKDNDWSEIINCLPGSCKGSNLEKLIVEYSLNKE